MKADASYAWQPEYRYSGFLSYRQPIDWAPAIYWNKMLAFGIGCTQGGSSKWCEEKGSKRENLDCYSLGAVNNWVPAFNRVKSISNLSYRSAIFTALSQPFSTIDSLNKQKNSTRNLPIGWMHSFVNVHLIHGNRMFWLTVSVSKNITTSSDTIGTNKKLSGSVWKYSNIFGCVRVDTACLVVQPSTPLSLTRLKYKLISLLLPLTRILFSMNKIVFDRVSASLMINGRNACNVRSSFT